MKRNVAYLTETGKIRIMEDELPEPREKEVLIRVRSVGICGSDVSYYTRGATGMGKLDFPHVPGHECAGDVVRAGSDDCGLRPGDRVAIEPGVPCGECEYCRTGRYNLCGKISFMSSAVKRPGGEGGMAEYVIRPARYVYKIPDNMSYDQAALAEPVSVAVQAVKKSGLWAGQDAAVLGCGPIAGCLLLVMRAYGMNKIYMTDIVKKRAGRMKELGASEAYYTEKLEEDELDALLPGKVDAVFDTTCSATAVNASMHWLKKGGVIMEVGVPEGKKNLDMQTAFANELSIATTFRYANTYPLAIALMESGMLHPERLISHRFPFSDADLAMKKAASGGGDVMKVMIETTKSY